MVEQIRLSIPGISCDGWVTTLRMVVRRLDGIEEVEGDTNARTLSVRFDSTRASVDEIQAALRGVGYDASLLD